MIFAKSCSFSDVEGISPYYESVKFKKGSILSLRKDMTLDGNEITAFVDSGTGDGARNNLSCGNLGMKSPSNGISMNVYGNQNVNSVGIQWWEPIMGAERFYWIYINKSGDFVIHKADFDSSAKKRIETSLKTFSSKKTGIKASESNNISTYLDSNGDMNIFLNGTLYYVIPQNELMFSEGNFFIVYQTIAKFKYSAENPAVAKFNLRGQM